jgi:hypothetical protein
MALYLGDNKIKININGIKYYLNLFSSNLILNGVALLSSDNYILQDSEGIYLVADDSFVVDSNLVKLLPLDAYALKESNGLYLVYKESE